MALTFAQLLQRLSFRQLQVFQTVQQMQSFSRAAVELGLTQPAVSSQIRQLENALGQPVFDYVGKKLFLTATGEQLLGFVNTMFADLSRLQMEVAKLQGQTRGDLRIAAVSTAQHIVPHILKGFLADYPFVDVQVQVIARSQAISRLRDNLDDLLLMGMVPDSSAINILPFLENQLVAVAQANSPVARVTSPTTEEFLREGLLARERGSGTRQALEQWSHEQHIPLEPRLTLGSNEAVKQGVLAGLGVAILPRLSVQGDVKAGTLCIIPLPGFPLRRSWSVVYSKGKHPTPVMQAFMDHVKANMSHLQQTLYA